MRLRAALAAVALVGFLVPAVPAAPPACAAQASHAALVIKTPATVLHFCVALDHPSVSGLDLIQLAHDQYGLAYRSDGEAVCMLAGTGTTQGGCFGDYPNFWGYWRGRGASGWAWAGRGAATTPVRAGEVQGWSWGPGDTGATHAPPPSTTFASVCSGPVASPSATPTPHASPHPSPSPSTVHATPASSPPRTKTHDQQQGRKPRHTGSPRPRSGPLGHSRPSAKPSPIAAAETGSAKSRASVPGAAIVAVGLAALMAVAGWFLVRRRDARG